MEYSTTIGALQLRWSACGLDKFYGDNCHILANKEEQPPRTAIIYLPSLRTPVEICIPELSRRSAEHVFLCGNREASPMQEVPSLLLN